VYSLVANFGLFITKYFAHLIECVYIPLYTKCRHSSTYPQTHTITHKHADRQQTHRCTERDISTQRHRYAVAQTDTRLDTDTGTYIQGHINLRTQSLITTPVILVS
jgi:hypothetical protein